MTTQSNDIRTHTISVLVDNEAGVLARVIGLFSGRGYNIESLTVAQVDVREKRSKIPLDCLYGERTGSGAQFGQKAFVFIRV